jgi:hypothetical protein
VRVSPGAAYAIGDGRDKREVALPGSSMCCRRAAGIGDAAVRCARYDLLMS